MTTPNEPIPNEAIEPTSPAGPAAPASSEAHSAAFTPPPDRRPDWAASAWADRPEVREPETRAVTRAVADPTSESEAGSVPGPSLDTIVDEPGVLPVVAPTPVASTPARRGTGLGSIVVAAALSAVLAAGGTVAALKGSGALDQRTTGGSGNPAQTIGSKVPVTIEESSAVIDAAAKAGPAVVRILVQGTTTDGLGGAIPDQGVGSGIIFDPAGWILTNRHVVTNADGSTANSLTVELKDGHQYTGTVYGIDTLTDLAIVKIDATGLTAASIGSSSDLKVGELAVAIGSPLGSYSNSVTSGIVSATGRSVTVQSGERLNNLIQTDAAINPGNSGGPLLDAGGNVIGINTAVATGSNGIGFAIPVDIARPIMQQAIAGQKLSRPYIGIRYETITPQVQDANHLSVDHGALVSKAQDASGASLDAVVANGPAAKAGIKDGDIIEAVGNHTIDTEHPLDLVLASYAPGQSVDLTILRGTSTLTISVTLGTRPANL